MTQQVSASVAPFRRVLSECIEELQKPKFQTASSESLITAERTLLQSRINMLGPFLDSFEGESALLFAEMSLLLRCTSVFVRYALAHLMQISRKDGMIALVIDYCGDDFPKSYMRSDYLRKTDALRLRILVQNLEKQIYTGAHSPLQNIFIQFVQNQEKLEVDTITGRNLAVWAKKYPLKQGLKEQLEQTTQEKCEFAEMVLMKFASPTVARTLINKEAVEKAFHAYLLAEKANTIYHK